MKDHDKLLRFLLAITLIAYVVVVLWYTIFSRVPVPKRIFKWVFWEVKNEYWTDITCNILFFIPIGFLTVVFFGDKAILYSVCFSLLIESVQFIFKLGFCELDDILNNSIGALIGLKIAKICEKCISERLRREMYSNYFKRLIDFLIGLVSLPFLLIVTLIIAPIIYCDDKGPVFYNAERLGLNGKPFKMYKFRSMKVNAPDIRNADGSTYNGDDDPRVTKIGRFMRRNSIDELPQFLNVFLGHMSVIGPRPDPLSDMAIYTEEQKTKLKVRPGITGYNQAYYRNSVTQDEKFEHDVYYANHISFCLDIKIFFKTIATVLGQDNVYNDVSAPTADQQKEIESLKK